MAIGFCSFIILYLGITHLKFGEWLVHQREYWFTHLSPRSSSPLVSSNTFSACVWYSVQCTCVVSIYCVPFPVSVVSIIDNSLRVFRIFIGNLQQYVKVAQTNVLVFRLVRSIIILVSICEISRYVVICSKPTHFWLPINFDLLKWISLCTYTLCNTYRELSANNFNGNVWLCVCAVGTHWNE